ncbi:MAG TPA: 16S rRNA (guanine(527)-N(7))-methyltransferase RsmG [Burkholderiales bacterium]|nr:16S rRNA (guanine(527)-N(7))-methyltransferase RsmG [Burkholderiales bacterium]
MTLEAGVDALGLDLPAPSLEKLLDYASLIEKWNRVYNLTAIREREKIVSHHLLDSLSVLPHLDGTDFADVGSGAGLPGIPMAIARPEWNGVLIESNTKKDAFLRQVSIELGLSNVAVFEGRVEDLKERRFDLVISRAFAETGEFVRLAMHLCKGRLAAMKGKHFEAELSDLPSGVRVEKIIPL